MHAPGWQHMYAPDWQHMHACIRLAAYACARLAYTNHTVVLIIIRYITKLAPSSFLAMLPHMLVELFITHTRTHTCTLARTHARTHTHTTTHTHTQPWLHGLPALGKHSLHSTFEPLRIFSSAAGPCSADLAPAGLSPVLLPLPGFTIFTIISGIVYTAMELQNHGHYSQPNCLG